MKKTKMKTKKVLSRRFKITARGKVLRGYNFKRHLRRNKSAKQKRRFKQTTTLSSVYARKVKKALGVT